MDRGTAEKRQLFKRIVFTAWSFLVSYSFVYAYLGAYLNALVCIFTAAVLVPTIYLLDQKNHPFSARVLCIFSSVFVITLSSVGLQNKVNAEYYYLPSIMLSLLLFEPHQKKAIWMSVLTPLFAWIMLEIIPVPDAILSLIPKNFPNRIFSVINFMGAFGITFIFLNLYGRSFKRLNRIALDNEHKLMQAAKMASLGELAGGIAHEINNPLSIIMGRTQLLKQKIEAMKSFADFDPVSCSQNLDKIEDTATLIAKIVKGLSSFSRKSDQDPMVETPFNQIIDYTLEICREKLKSESIKLRITYNADIVIRCRDSQIAQVLMNLVSNAIDAIENLPEKWIDISVSATRNNVRFAITDSGKGIPPSIVDKIMQPFFSTKEAGKGIGLGLSISKGIIEEHNGTLKYDDSFANTRFVLELPRV